VYDPQNLARNAKKRGKLATAATAGSKFLFFDSVLSLMYDRRGNHWRCCWSSHSDSWIVFGSQVFLAFFLCCIVFMLLFSVSVLLARMLDVGLRENSSLTTELSFLMLFQSEVLCLFPHFPPSFSFLLFFRASF
jgi:hypothetical protein